MTKPKMSIFIRILLATLVPLVFIFSIVLVTINLIIHQANTNYARQRTELMTAHAAAETATILSGHARMLEFACRNLQAVMTNPDSGMVDAREFLHNLVQSTPDAHSVWLVLEQGALNQRDRQGYSYARERDQISDMRKIDPQRLADPLLSPWYHLPRSLRGPAFVPVVREERGERTRDLHGSLAYPVIIDGHIAAVAGMELSYESDLAFLKDWEDKNQQNIMLLAENGVILHASNPELLNRDIAGVGFQPEFRKTIRDTLRSGEPARFQAPSPFLRTDSLYHLEPVRMTGGGGRLFVLTETPLNALLREADRATRLILSTSILGFILLGVSVFCATRNIVKPIRRLTENAQKVAHGKLDAFPSAGSSPQGPRHEVDQLEDSIRSMVDQLAQTHELGIMAMEAQLEREKIAQASEAKTRFFANMSHEIRTPMNAILGMSELLLSEKLGDREAKYANDIKLAAESLLAIINDILDLSKMESGELSLLCTHYDLATMLEDLNSLCAYLAEKKSLAFSMALPADLPRYLFGDNIRLRQVILNVIGNGIKFTESGSVRLQAVNEGTTIRFDVADTGVGIKPEDMDNLFHPFRQLDEKKNRKLEGTGLGLSISRNLVELMAGEIWVESEYGKGSVFHIRIPVVPGNPEYIEAHHEAVQAMFTPDTRVLIVDDNPVNLDVAAGLIGMFGITCDTASSGAEAIAKIREEQYDIVFMDHMMPEMDGVEATKALRAMGGRFADQVIVALTANAVIGTREMFLESGMNDFLSKPIVKEKLQAILYRWLPEARRADIGEEELEEIGLVDTATFRLRASLREGAATATAEKTLASRLAGVPGLNVRLGLENVGGSEDIYAGVLRRMLEMRREIPEKLRAVFAEGDLQRFKVEIHSTKGGMANIGAVRLAADAAAMERAAGEGDGEAIANKLDEYLACVEEFFGEMEKAIHNA